MVGVSCRDRDPNSTPGTRSERQHRLATALRTNYVEAVLRSRKLCGEREDAYIPGLVRLAQPELMLCLGDGLNIRDTRAWQLGVMKEKE